jgi:hypothetical protein
MLRVSKPQAANVTSHPESVQQVIPFTLIGKTDDELAVRAPPQMESDYGRGRYDGHHKMVDFMLRKKTSAGLRLVKFAITP